MAISELLATLDAIKTQHPEAYEYLISEGRAQGRAEAFKEATSACQRAWNDAEKLELKDQPACEQYISYIMGQIEDAAKSEKEGMK